ncbi:helicase [Psilogramma increta granulovirus]|uniref:Helicase n=1 Tax=Psilogramma increta granulovirus TaxID=2953508 RepID=A0A977XU66_9BBAC|nr:helicase [Psilogramma increta granulovirus]
MSMDDIMNSYESVTKFEPFSHNRVYFSNGVIKKTRPQYKNNTATFLHKLLSSTMPETTHSWCMLPNYYNTKIVPFLPYDDYELLMTQHRNVFEFCTIRNNKVSTPTRVGDYMVWWGVSANLLGWTIYLFLNTGYKLTTPIPLCNHRKLGNYNLLSNNNHNIDVACKVMQNDQLLFTNTSSNPLSSNVITLTLNNKTSEPITVLFGTDYVFTKNTWLDYLVNNDCIKSGTFASDYSFICNTINFDMLRWVHDKCEMEQNQDIDNMDNNHNNNNSNSGSNTIDTLSPCSKYEVNIINTIDECLNVINELMLAKCSPAITNTDNILKFYLQHNKYSTLYIVIIAIWQYCEATIKMHNQYELQDMLFFLKTICTKVTNDNKNVFVDHLVYFSSEKNAKNFLNSLQFFMTPDQGIEHFFDAISAYFSLHLAIFKKTGGWQITSMTIKEATDVDITTKSVGFYKKIKVNKFDYIFTGNIYENYKNKKDHSVASVYDSCPEISVSELVFNKTLNFYMTQSGLFDVCKKIYREPCPFVVMSTLKKNFIGKNQTYLEEETFRTLYSCIDNDLMLLKIYHARKFMEDYTVLINNIKDSRILGDNMRIERQEMLNNWRDMINWLLECKGTDIVLLVLYLKKHLTQAIGNIVSLSLNVDVLGLKSALICHLMWPKSNVEQFFWALMTNYYHDFEDWMDGTDFLVTENEFKNKKKITEGMINILRRIDYDETEIHMLTKNMIKNVGPIDEKKYEVNRILKNVGSYYKKFDKIVKEYNVWTDALIGYRKNESMYNWLTRFYMRIFLKNCPGDILEIMNVVMGYSYFRVFTNFHINNSKALINFCASLAIPVDYEKMCLVLSSKPNCGKSSLWELLSTMILVYKQDKEHYKHNKNEKDEKVKKYESQLYVMNEAQLITKAYLKGIVDSTKIDQARCNYGIMEKFNSTYKTLICNNDDDKIYVTDGYDRACSNRLGQMYFDHEFNELRDFSGSVYEHHVQKRYCEERDIVTKLAEPVKAFLANVLKYNCDPNDGQLYYKVILQGDNSYKYNKKCLYIYNTVLEALLYVMNVRECKNAPEFSEEKLMDLIKCAEKYVPQMLHYKKRNSVSMDGLCAEFKRKYNSNSRFFNFDTKMYSGLQIAMDERQFNQYPPKFKANVDETQ